LTLTLTAVEHFKHHKLVAVTAALIRSRPKTVTRRTVTLGTESGTLSGRSEDRGRNLAERHRPLAALGAPQAQRATDDHGVGQRDAADD
jgi:hypothetical protein